MDCGGWRVRGVGQAMVEGAGAVGKAAEEGYEEVADEDGGC